MRKRHRFFTAALFVLSFSNSKILLAGEGLSLRIGFLGGCFNPEKNGSTVISSEKDLDKHLSKKKPTETHSCKKSFEELGINLDEELVIVIKATRSGSSYSSLEIKEMKPGVVYIGEFNHQSPMKVTTKDVRYYYSPAVIIRKAGINQIVLDDGSIIKIGQD